MIVYNEEIGFHIGFGGEYYTLWSISRPEKNDYQKATFLGNISKNLDISKEKYPTAKVSLHLKGDNWDIQQNPKDSHAPDCFQFGKYSGTKIEDCNDLNYILWYANNAVHSVSLIDIMQKKGYELIDDEFVTLSKKIELLRLKDLANKKANSKTKATLVSNINTDSFTIAFQRFDCDDSEIERLLLSDELINKTSLGEYNQYSWLYIKDISKRRSMKGIDVILDIKNNVIVGISKI